MAAPTLFDTALVRRRLERAAGATGHREAQFLLDRTADELAARLDAVLRPFRDALDLGTPGPQALMALLARPGLATTTHVGPLAAGPRGEGPASVRTIDADLEHLPLDPASVDLAVSLLALQAVNDLPGVLVQVRRALRPDGLFLACLAGTATLTELRQSLAQAESELDDGISPRVAPFADVRDLGALLQRAGFALPVADAETVVVRYADPLALLRDLRAMGATNSLAERRRVPLRRATLLRALAIYAERFSDPDGRVRATVELVWLSGWAPDPSQQKPLRPGSARQRLADALKTVEQPLAERPPETSPD